MIAMLAQLYIENVAVIEKTLVAFGKNLNVLTGETGAGKSILIDSVNAVLGERVSRDLVRTGVKSARVSAVFEDLSPECVQKAQELGFEPEEGSLIFQRDITAEGKSTCRINGCPATVSSLRELGRCLLSIHGQHENYELLSSELHRSYVDRMGVDPAALSQYQTVFYQLETVRKKLNGLVTDTSQKARRMDLLQYQIQELEDAGIRPGEREELGEQRRIYQNSEKISESLGKALQILSGEEDGIGVVSALREATDFISVSAQYIPEAQNISERVQSCMYDLEDCLEEIRILADKTEYDPQELEAIEDRLDLLYRLSMKYGSTEEEMLEFLSACQEEMKTIEFSDELYAQLSAQEEQLLNQAKTLADTLSVQRRKAGELLSRRVQEELRFLNMPSVEFISNQTQCELSETGCDKIEFLISTNPGESPKPLSKIASGGELSRIMLAIKTVLAEFDSIGSMVFDEIDTGISGNAAYKVGLKLREVGKHRQVICVTHSAQIAALANSHYKIEKHVENGRTFTCVSQLDEEQRVEELARIMGGNEITPLLRQNCAEMLKQAKNA